MLPTMHNFANSILCDHACKFAQKLYEICEALSNTCMCLDMYTTHISYT